MAQIKYTKTEKFLLDEISYLDEIPLYELKQLANDFDN